MPRALRWSWGGGGVSCERDTPQVALNREGLDSVEGTLTLEDRARANSEHIRQSGPEYGPDLQVQVLKNL
jgi:hypothetical protein